MSALITVHGQKAFLRQGEWSCADLKMERLLNRTTRLWIQETGRPPVDDRDPDRTAAVEVARRLGGRLMLNVAPRGQGAGATYFKQRQLELDFAAGR